MDIINLQQNKAFVTLGDLKHIRFKLDQKQVLKKAL